MLQSSLRRQGLPVALGAALVATLSVGAYLLLALQRVGPIAGPVSLLCELIGPPLPIVGAALAPAALAVMAPCLLQLALVLAATSAGLATAERTPPWRTGLAFAAGFLGVYAVAAAVVAVAGQSLTDWAPLLQALGGLLLALLGLAVLRLLPRRALSGCRGPRWLILTGKANLRRPVGAGAAFAVYCLGCCGPYLAGLALLGAGSGSALGGAALVVGFALLMGALLLLPLLSVAASRGLQATLQRHGQPIALASGAALIALGLAIALEPLALLALAR
jgi:cytochrome c biogenesis protein CcdA